jgi:hypothetical protein
MATIATLSVDVGVGKNDITAFLSQLQSQLQAADAAAQKAAASIGSAFGSAGSRAAASIKQVTTSSQQAANAELQLAQAEARGLSIKGQLASASQRLSSAIQQYSQAADSSAASVLRLQNAENQLATVQAKIQASAVSSTSSLNSLKTAFDGISTSAAAFGIGLGIGALVQVGTDAIKSANSLEKTEAAVRALSGSQAKYNELIDLARGGQQKYGGTLEDNIRGLGALVNTSSRYGVELVKLDNLSRRLAAADPEQGIKGATFALREFLSGSGAAAGKSLVQRFELSKQDIDPFGNSNPIVKVEALNEALNKMGITQDVLNGQAATNAIKYDQFAASLDNAKVAAGALAAVALGPVVQDITKLLNLSTSSVPQSAQGFGQLGTQIGRFANFVQPVTSSVLGFGGAITGLNIGAVKLVANLAGTTSAGQAVGDAIKLAADQASAFTGIDLAGYLGLGNAALIDSSNAFAQSGQAAAAAGPPTLAQAQAMIQSAASGQLLKDAQDQVIAVTQESANASLTETTAKQQNTLQTQVLQQQVISAANAYLALNPNVTASGIAQDIAAGRISAAIGIYSEQILAIQRTRTELALLQAQAGNAASTAAANQTIAFNRATGRIGRGDAGDTRLDREAVGKQLADQRNAEINLAQAQNNHAKEIALLKNAQVGLNKNSADYINLQAKIVKAEDDAAKAGKKRATGGGAVPGISNVRLTDQQKLQNSLLANQESFANKSESEETKHQQKLTEIDTQYAQKRNEVDKKFHLDRLQGEADFYEGLSSIKDRGVQKQIDAQYQQALLKAEEIARTKGGDAANAFLDAQTSIIQKRGSLLDKIAGLTDKKGKDKQTQQSDANQAEYLRGVLALQERASALKLQQVEGEGSQIAAERDRQLADENAHFQSATDQLTNKAADSAEKRVNASIRAAKQVDQEALAVENLGTAYTNVADAILTGARAATAAAPTGVVFPKKGASSAVGTPQVNVTGPTGNVPTTPDNTPVPVEITKQQTSGNPVVDAVNAVRATLESVGRDIVSAENATARSVRSISVSPLVTR